MKVEGPLVGFPESLAPEFVYLVGQNIREMGIPQERLLHLLSPEERQRAERFRFPDDRLRYRTAWGLSRIWLGALRGEDPRDIAFVRDAYQKPHVQGGPSFNMSHSGDWVLLGLAGEGRLGVDVESLRDIGDLDDLASTVFSVSELAELRGLPDSQKSRAFFRGWTRKEAFVKAMGLGLSAPLKEISVSLATGVEEALVSLDIPSERRNAWHIRPLPDLPDASSAIAWDRPLEGVVWMDPRAGDLPPGNPAPVS